MIEKYTYVYITKYTKIRASQSESFPPGLCIYFRETGWAEFIPIFTLTQLAKVVLDSVRFMNYGIYAILTKGSNYSQTFVWDHFSELIHSSPECKNNFSRQYQFTQL